MPYFALLSALLIVATPFAGSQAFDLSAPSPDAATLIFDDYDGSNGYDDGGSADLDDPDNDGDDEDARAPDDEDDGEWDIDDTDRSLRT